MNLYKKIVIFCAAGLTMLMTLTDPNKMGLPILILPFALIFTMLTFSIRGLLLWRRVSGLKAVRMAILISALPTLILGLDALGQLSLRDVATIIILFGITYFYLGRVSPSAAQ